MSEPRSALNGQVFDGLVHIREMGPQGMITLRGDAKETAFGASVKKATGLSLPETRGIVANGERAIAWMSPDEWLVLCAYDGARDLGAGLRGALDGQHHLVENVSDARAMFALTGEAALLREVLAKLAPADLHPDRFGPGEMRRTRLAQVPAAIWLQGEGEARVVCFRSVARYVFDLLCTAAAPGSAVGYFKV